jgi:hypothetical protein
MELKHPENQKIKNKLQRGDVQLLTEYSGLAEATVRLILIGYRRMNDRLAKAIIRLMNERRELKQALDEIAEAEDL